MEKLTFFVLTLGIVLTLCLKQQLYYEDIVGCTFNICQRLPGALCCVLPSSSFLLLTLFSLLPAQQKPLLPGRVVSEGVEELLMPL